MMRPEVRLLAGALTFVLAATVVSAAPIHKATNRGDLEEIDRLIAEGTDVDLPKWGLHTPLALAAQNGDLVTARHLVENHQASLSPTITKYPSYCALNLAAVHNHRDVAEYLVLQGADPNVLVPVTKKKRDQIRSNRPDWPWDEWIGEYQAEIDHQNRRAQAARVEQERRENHERIEARWSRDQALPPTVRRDKYLLALKKEMGEGDYEAALIYFGFLERLELPLDSSFDLYHGETLLNVGQREAGLDKLYSFVQKVDSRDQNYTHALKLINEAEGR